MCIKYSLGLAGCVLLSGLAGAQSGTTLPRAQPRPIQPTPIRPVPIQPVPTGKATPAQANPYPTPLYRANDVATYPNLGRGQMNRPGTAAVMVPAQSGELNALNPTDQFARTRELNRLYANEWNGATGVPDEQQPPRNQQLDPRSGGFNAPYNPDLPRQALPTPEQVQGLRAQVEWSNQQLNPANGLGAAGATGPSRDNGGQGPDLFGNVLTPEQQRAWQQIFGVPSPFQPTVPRR
jgi:hypothetical protein